VRPVYRSGLVALFGRYGDSIVESGCLRLQLEMGGKFHPRLNNGKRPIAKKYREGKMKRTLKRK